MCASSRLMCARVYLCVIVRRCEIETNRIKLRVPTQPAFLLHHFIRFAVKMPKWEKRQQYFRPTSKRGQIVVVAWYNTDSSRNVNVNIINASHDDNNNKWMWESWPKSELLLFFLISVENWNERNDDDVLENYLRLLYLFTLSLRAASLVFSNAMRCIRLRRAEPHWIMQIDFFSVHISPFVAEDKKKYFARFECVCVRVNCRIAV